MSTKIPAWSASTIISPTKPRHSSGSTIDRAVNTQPLASSGNYLADRQQLTSAPVNGAIELLHIFSPSLLNEFKFGFNRSTADTTDINQTGMPYAFAVSGFTNLNNNKVSIGVGNSFSEIDNLTWVKGRHTVKAGVEIRRIQLNQGNTEAGTVYFRLACRLRCEPGKHRQPERRPAGQRLAQDAVLRLHPGRIQVDARTSP